MRFPFTKMHGLGNDFIVLDAREGGLPPIDGALAAALADRHTGIGCDQLILLEPSVAADLRMRIFNSDGSEVESCGNAARAIGLLYGAPARIETAGETAGITVWATGWRGLEALSQALGKTVGTGIKGQSLTLRYNAADRPQLFVDGLHIVPHADGTVAIGSTSERSFDDPAGIDSQCDALHARAVAALPLLAGAPVVERWAGVRPRARSRAPMLGPWPGRPGHYIANGGFKIGFGMAPKVAEVMADLVLDGRDAIPSGFRVEASL